MANYIEGESNDGRANLVARGKGLPDTFLSFGGDGLPGAILPTAGIDITADVTDVSFRSATITSGFYMLCAALYPQNFDAGAGVITLTLDWDDYQSSSRQDTSLTLDLSLPPSPANIVDLFRFVYIDESFNKARFTITNSGSYGTGQALLFLRLFPLS